jgi:hypothetical protein
MSRPVFRVFISSTAADLRDHRAKVRDAVLRLEHLPVAMETFSARPGLSTIECMKMAAEADAVVCIAAHRYGYVPPPELGGDGVRSITWLEVDAAVKANKPVFAFLVDQNAPWSGLRDDESSGASHGGLKDFRSFLESQFLRNTFFTDDELAKHVCIALANFAAQHTDVAGTRSHEWKPLFCHALQPAQNFRGRNPLLADIVNWLTRSSAADHVVSIVAAGGTGKTALVREALRRAATPIGSGCFVWSFYEEPNSNEFLRRAYKYFVGNERSIRVGEMFEELQAALATDRPHLLVLDGLERVQATGGVRLRGEIDDPLLKRRWGNSRNSYFSISAHRS